MSKRDKLILLIFFIIMLVLINSAMQIDQSFSIKATQLQTEREELWEKINYNQQRIDELAKRIDDTNNQIELNYKWVKDHKWFIEMFED